MDPKITQTTTIPGAGGQERSLQRLLQQLAEGGASQLGDLTSLAQGQGGMPTGADQELVGASIQRARQMAEEQMRVAGSIQGAQLRERLTSRGASGSSAEVAENLLQSLGTQGGINQAILQAQQSGGQALLNLPFQRGQQQLQANQALFQRIIGSASPVLQAGLQERLAQTTTTQQQSGGQLGQLAQLGQSLASIVSMGSGQGLKAAAGAGGGGQSSMRIPNSTGGFSTFDPSQFIGPFGGGGLQ